MLRICLPNKCVTHVRIVSFHTFSHIFKFVKMTSAWVVTHIEYEYGQHDIFMTSSCKLFVFESEHDARTKQGEICATHFLENLNALGGFDEAEDKEEEDRYDDRKAAKILLLPWVETNKDPRGGDVWRLRDDHPPFVDFPHNTDCLTYMLFRVSMDDPSPIWDVAVEECPIVKASSDAAVTDKKTKRVRCLNV